jgi:hypothetical protein
MSNTAFAIQAVSINASTFAGVKGQQIDGGQTVLSGGYDGTVQETLQTIISRRRSFEWDTVQCKTMLTALGTSGSSPFPCIALDGSNGLVMYGGRSAVSLPGYSASAIHISRTALNGVVVMERMSWAQDQEAVMHCKAFVLSADGTTDPVTAATTVAFATLPNPQNTQVYVLSALTANGVSLGTVRSMDLSIGHKFDYDMTTGLPYPLMVSGAGPKGPAEIRLTADITDCSQAEGTGSVSCVFTALAAGGTLGSSTITFTFQSPWTLEDAISGSKGGPMTRKFTARPTFGGSTYALTWVST